MIDLNENRALRKILKKSNFEISQKVAYGGYFGDQDVFSKFIFPKKSLNPPPLRVLMQNEHGPNFKRERSLAC